MSGRERDRGRAGTGGVEEGDPSFIGSNSARIFAVTT